MCTARVEAFSDGVFAAAITLLVVDLRVPITSGSLLTTLATSGRIVRRPGSVHVASAV